MLVEHEVGEGMVEGESFAEDGLRECPTGVGDDPCVEGERG